MSIFDPETVGFVRLHDFQFMGGIDVYEYRNHPVVDGAHDFLRLNIYLSKDGDFITIWNGLLEPMGAEAQFELPEPLKTFSFHEAYCETLFRGYIEQQEDATTILSALRLNSARYSGPQVLSGAPHDLRCEIISSSARQDRS